jgi:hypothetical protein
MVVYLSSVGLLSRNNNSTRYAANLQTTQTPDSVIALVCLRNMSQNQPTSERPKKFATQPTLVVPKLDRLARSVPDARAIADQLAAKGVKLALGHPSMIQQTPWERCSSTS